MTDLLTLIGDIIEKLVGERLSMTRTQQMDMIDAKEDIARAAIAAVYDDLAADNRSSKVGSWLAAKRKEALGDE